MIRKLRIKFIALSMAALFVLLAIILTSMNVINDLPRDMSPETP